MNLFCSGRAGAVASAASEKVRTRLEELDDFEEVSMSPAVPLGACLPRASFPKASVFSH